MSIDGALLGGGVVDAVQGAAEETVRPLDHDVAEVHNQAAGMGADVAPAVISSSRGRLAGLLRLSSILLWLEDL